ncbi:hypothetical protein Patl1_31787 [Pistacia atlantica]|uniref:Uncharacterized protein n=1 Tax=Pistacia atlantica TaxID=434234 RepID=A0ACC1APQ0_9ROSI|nr:hypothetical protein Patl1_31787 [Pistacia atlantica]
MGFQSLPFPKFPTFFIVLFSLLLSFNTSKSQNLLRRGSSLSVEDASDVLSSPDKTFTCGFYGLGQNAYWFSIWFTNSKERTVVWMANRDRPVNGHGSKVTLRRNGAMVLTDVDDWVIWMTNTTSTSAYRAELLDTGNSCFNERRCVYWPNPDYNVWQNGRTSYNSSRIAFLDEAGSFLSSDKWQFRAFDVGFGIKRRLTMDYDGNLRLYSLNNLTGSWMISWQAIMEQCKVHGICGRNGICVSTPEPKCSCPPGYEVTEPDNWNKGCSIYLKFPVSVEASESDSLNGSNPWPWAPAWSQGLPSLIRGSSLAVAKENDFLASPKETFSGGFYKVGTNAYCFAIWFTNSVNKTVVWMANRDKPVNGRHSRLTLHGNGNLVLTDEDESVVWSTNTLTNAGVEARLLETGNLVLVNQAKKDHLGEF